MKPNYSTSSASNTCLNCKADTIGPYCHKCGQKQERRIISLRTMLQKAIGEYWSLDNRFLRTLKILLFKPGQLTVLWRKGKRTDYLPPFRLYIIFSVIYFFILGVLQSNTFLMGTVNMDPEAGVIFQKWLPRIMFILMPLFAAALKILHPRHNRYYVEHLVFSIHFYSFFFLIDSLRTLISYWAGYTGQPIDTLSVLIIIPVLFLSFIPIFYLGIALKKAYPQSIGMVILRIVILMAGYFLVALLSVLPIIYYLTNGNAF